MAEDQDPEMKRYGAQKIERPTQPQQPPEVSPETQAKLDALPDVKHYGARMMNTEAMSAPAAPAAGGKANGRGRS